MLPVGRGGRKKQSFRGGKWECEFSVRDNIGNNQRNAGLCVADKELEDEPFNCRLAILTQSSSVRTHRLKDSSAAQARHLFSRSRPVSDSTGFIVV